MAKKDELTTLMHYDFLCEEMLVEDIKIYGVFGAMKGGLSKKEALNKYGISEQLYDENIERVLNS
jgi:hypothetical protein